jgi:hypothetical protein
MEKEADEMPGGVATLTIQSWQRALKRVELELTWQEGGQESDFMQYTYIHEATAP